MMIFNVWADPMDGEVGGREALENSTVPYFDAQP
jgi:hypothetical protein